jgi:hypothetical protein
MGRPAGWMTELTGRSPMKSPGKPSLRRDPERLFWREIGKGLTSDHPGSCAATRPHAEASSTIERRSRSGRQS